MVEGIALGVMVEEIALGSALLGRVRKPVTMSSSQHAD